MRTIAAVVVGLILLSVILSSGCVSQSFYGSVKTNTVNGRIANIEVRFPSNTTLNNSSEIDNAIAQTEMILFALKDARQYFKRNDEQ